MGQVAVADFATAYTALCLGFACAEGGEVIVKQETLAALVEHVVQDFFVKLGAQRHCRQRLGLAAGEDSRSVRAGNVVHLAPYGTDFGSLAAVETHALVKNAAAHGLFFDIVVVTLYKRGLFVALFLGKAGDVFLADGVERVLTPVLVGASGLGDGIGLVVALVVYVLAQVLVVYFVAVFALGLGLGLLGQFHLGHALLLDGLVGRFQSLEQCSLRDFVHFALYHHDIVVGGAYHEFEVCFFEFLKGGVDDKFAVDTGNAHLADRSVERYVADGDCCRGRQSGQRVGHVDAVARVHGDVDKCVGVIVVREQRTQNTVNQTRGQDFVVVGAAFALQEAAGETAGSRKLLFVFNLQGHEVDALAGLLGRYNSCQEHGIAHAQLNRSISLLGQLAGFQSNLTAVRQGDGFFDNVH